APPRSSLSSIGLGMRSKPRLRSYALSLRLRPQSARGRPATRVRLEALEQRRLLTAEATWVDEDWFDLAASEFGVRGDGILRAGDSVINFGDVDEWGDITKIYGQDGFGKVTNTNVASLAGMATINDAIQHTTPADDGSSVLTILQGTFAESDI